MKKAFLSPKIVFVELIIFKICEEGGQGAPRLRTSPLVIVGDCQGKQTGILQGQNRQGSDIAVPRAVLPERPDILHRLQRPGNA